VWIEMLRIDPSHEIAGVRLNVFVAGAAILLSAAFFVVWQRRWKRGGGSPAPKVETMAVPKGR
jgi:glycerol-3-phosphate O-acyltransferase